jgi:hypothetical protein
MSAAARQMNALAHGMTARTVVLPHENAEEYEAMHQGLDESYRPANQNENVLVTRIAQAYWRMQRCYSVERAFLENRTSGSEDPEAAMANLFVDKAESARMRLMMRYVAAAERAYYKAMADLNKAQAERRKQEKLEAYEEAFAANFVSQTPAPADADRFVSQPDDADFVSQSNPANFVSQSTHALYEPRV